MLQANEQSLGCGIHQGSVLSPTLFNLVMDPLLFKEKILGSEQKWSVGSFAHTDEIRTLASNTEDSARQGVQSAPMQGASNSVWRNAH